jgi:alkylhydroperoxidase/carboxymuconolactone decarboxylase family protein YurZ
MITVEHLRANAETLLQACPDGDALDAKRAALIDLGVCGAVTSLNPDDVRARISAAIEAGASREQIQEIMTLVSGLGVHTFMVGSRVLGQELVSRGKWEQDAALDSEQQTLWDRHIGSDSYWDRVEQEMPGFLKNLLRLSPAAFEGFFAYCALPWRSRHVDALTKELVSMACDATPAHCYGPGMRLHLHNALKLGAGRRQILQALAIGADAPAHRGVD